MSKRKPKKPSQETQQNDYRPWLVHIVRWLSYAAVATVLIADNGSPTVSSLSKISFFQLFTGVAIAGWLALAISNKNYRPNWKNPVVLGATLFLALSSLSLFTSVDPYRSFWSNAYRLTGTFNYLHYWLWMLALSSTHRGWSEWKPILWITNGVAVLVNGIGISRWLIEDEGRIRSTIDNALYLADFALLSSFLSAILIARSKTRWVRIMAAGTLVINAWATILTGSRSTAGALAIGVLTVAAWFVITKAPAKKRPLAIGVLTALLISSAALFFYVRSERGNSFAQKLPQAVQRIALTRDFGQDRAALAQIALTAVKERPLLGWGAEHFDVAFESNYGPIGVDVLLPEAWYDRAHNQFLDILVMNGIIGFTGYMAFWALTMYALIRRLVRKETTNADANFIGLTAIVCYATALIFSFDLPGPMTWQWLLIAFLASSEMKPLEPEQVMIKVNNGIAYTLMIVALIAEMAFSIKPYLQAREMEIGCRLARSNPAEALASWRSALKSKTMATPELRFRVLGCVSDVISSQAPMEDRKNAIIFVGSQMDKAAETRPYDYKTLLAAGWIKLPARAIGIDELDQAEEYFNRAVAINPVKPRAYELLADLANQRGDGILKAEMLLKASDLAGNTVESTKFLARSATYFARNGEVHQAIVTYLMAYKTHEQTALANNSALPAISEALQPNTNIPDELIEASQKAVEMYGDAAHHAARLRFLLSGTEIDEERLNSAFAETQQAFPELAELIRGRLNE